STTEAIVATSQVASHYYSGTSTGLFYKNAIENLDSDMIPPAHDMSLSETSVKAEENGVIQKTDWITLNLDSRLSADVTLQDGITLYVEGESDGYTETATVPGGKRFYLEADLNENGIQDVTFKYTGNKLLKINILEPPSATYQPVAFYTYVNPEVTLSALFEAKGDLEIIKSSANTDMTDGNDCYSLQGAVYGVYSTYGNAFNDTNRITIITTDANGYGIAKDLTLGTYYVKEMTAPRGYRIDTGIYTAEVNSAITATRLSVKDVPGNDPLEIVVRKKDAERDIYLQGAKFVVKYYAVQMDTDPVESGYIAERTWYFITDENGEVQLFAQFLDPNKTSDEFYLSYTGAPTLPLGTITVQEYEAPEGYIVDDTVSVFQITDQQASTPTVERLNERTITNQPIKGIIQIKKTGERRVYNETTGQFVTSEINLSGIRFGIYSGSTLVETVTTDANGKATSGKLNLGTYTLMEINPPADHVGSKDITVTLTADDTVHSTNQDGEVETVIEAVTVKNTIKVPSIGTTAKDSVTGTNEGTIGKSITIIDTVSLKGLIVGEEYELIGCAYEPETGEPFIVDGVQMTSTVVFTADSEDCSVDVPFIFDSSLLHGKKLVFFETLYLDGEKVAVHADLTDEGQTITFPPAPPEDVPPTGDGAIIPVLIIILCVALLGVIMFSDKFN
ncbi:MAG: VaFE repeat-containing surface-anchored protein, partial [Lachnospiraceae bacterium]|nr:VaFE repeat-containing surface-anchored protein [Lachnospiraceae bacterium]